MTAYERVCNARAKGRPTSLSFINAIFKGFIEMHGDRRFADDGAIVAGIGIEKGVTTKEKVQRNFGSAHPEGYRKALRQMKLAEKFNRPIVCFVDTSGAACDMEAEMRGQAQAIAENLMEMMTLKVPIVSILIGEGGSGGALALAVADEVWMLENAVYSVLSPEASECLKLTAEDQKELGCIERIFEESDGFESLCTRMNMALVEVFRQLRQRSVPELLERRYQKYRRIGGARS